MRPNPAQLAQEESVPSQSLPTSHYPRNNIGNDFITADAVEPTASNSAAQVHAANIARQCPHCPFATTGRLEYVTRSPGSSLSTQLT